MAGYDWGPGNVQRAVQRTGYADFWELYRRNVLPQETKNYVPIILAAAIMAKNPQPVWTRLPSTFDPPVADGHRDHKYSVDLRLVSDVVEVPVQEIAGMNPSLLRMSTPPDTQFDLHIPAGKKEIYETRIAEIPEDKRKSWRYHKLVPGETMEDVAKNYHVSATEIAFVNQISVDDSLADTEALVIPVAPLSSAYSATHATTYVVRHGDTLVTVGDRFGVSVDQLRRWNHLKSVQVSSGRRLYVAEPAHITRTSAHTHKKGSRSTSSSYREKSKRQQRTQVCNPRIDHLLKEISLLIQQEKVFRKIRRRHHQNRLRARKLPPLRRPKRTEHDHNRAKNFTSCLRSLAYRCMLLL